MHNKAHAQAFKDERMERMTKRPSMPNVPPKRDPRRDGFKNHGLAGEQMTMAKGQQTMGATQGPRPTAYQQAAGPGMLPR